MGAKRCKGVDKIGNFVENYADLFGEFIDAQHLMEIKGDRTMLSHNKKRRAGRTHAPVSLVGNLGISLCLTSCEAEDSLPLSSEIQLTN